MYLFLSYCSYSLVGVPIDTGDGYPKMDLINTNRGLGLVVLRFSEVAKVRLSLETARHALEVLQLERRFNDLNYFLLLYFRSHIVI